MTITETELRDRLERWIEAITFKIAVEKCGVSKTFLHAVRKGERPISNKIAENLGYAFDHKSLQIERFYRPLKES